MTLITTLEHRQRNITKPISVTPKPIKIIVEKHPDGYIAYPIGLKGVVLGEGDTYGQAVADVISAIKFHIETFGASIMESEGIIERWIADVTV